MSRRLQVPIPPELDAQLRKSSNFPASPRTSISSQPSNDWQDDLVAKLAALSAPTGDIDQMLAEIEQGRF